MRRTVSGLALGVLLAAAAAVTVAQAPPPPPPKGAPAQAPEKEEPGQEALAWDRDFDLLLELKDTPTRAELKAAAERQALLEERDRLERQLSDLRSRLDALQGTYSTETLLNEMLRQGVSDVQSVTTNLEHQIRATRTKIADLDAKLKRLQPPGGSRP